MKPVVEIKQLLEKYFEGDTSLAEEKILRDYFTSELIDVELKMYAPIFQYLEKERMQGETVLAFRKSRKSKLFRFSIGIAACILLALGVMLYPEKMSVNDSEYDGCTGTYVRIEGTCYNDPDLVLSHAAQAISDLDILLAEDHSEE